METFEPRRIEGRAARNMAYWLAASTLRFGAPLPRRIHGNSRGIGGLLPARSLVGSGAHLPVPPMAHSAIPVPYSRAQGAAGGTIFEIIRNTSAAAVTPTQQREWLVGMWLEGGGAAGAGAWSFTYDGTHAAQYPVGGSGLDATGAIGPVAEAFYPLNYGPIGQNIPAASQSFGGGLAAVRFLLSNKPNPSAPPISAYTGVFVTGNESGTSGTAKTYSIPGPLGKPTALLALECINGTATGVYSAEIDLPSIGNYNAYSVPAMQSRGLEPVGPGSGYPFYPVPDYDPAASFSFTHKAISLGGAASLQVAGIMRYQWSNPQ